MEEFKQKLPSVKGILLDIHGVLYDSGEDGGIAIPGSVEALDRLRASGIPFRLCTNESQCSREILLRKLHRLGFKVSSNEITSPPPVAVAVVRERNLRPHILVHPDALSEFEGLESSSNPNCVLLGDAATAFTYEALNRAFVHLMQMEHPLIITMGKGKYYFETDGIKLDVGVFAHALQYATDCQVEVIGKPSSRYYTTALNEIGLSTEDSVLMIGDDIESDVGGSQAIGMLGVLVRTGKYRPSAENHPRVRPDAIVDNFAQFVDLVIDSRRQ